jgi:osmotically-inducible protein OsmY
MRVFLALVFGVLLGAGVLWVYTNRSSPRVQAAGDQVESAAKSAKDAIQDKLRVLDLRTNDFRDELEKTGRVIRRKAQETGKAIGDSTADARTTLAIKGKLLASKELSALSISVNTTDGIVTLSGTVNSPEDISKAMMLAMETDGAREVISTLQVKRKTG